MPVTMVRGKKTAIRVRVEAITDMATSFVPCTAACFGSLPLSICVVTFSNTTMASSTTIPIDIDNADSDTMLSVLPVAARYINEAIRETGIVITIIIVALQRPRNKNTTIITNNRAYSTVSSREAMVFRMLSDVSTMTPSLTSEGRFFCRRGNIFITDSEICTELAPLCFWITIMAPFSPPIKVRCVRSSKESSTRATSRR